MDEKRVEAVAKFLFTHAGFNWDKTSELARDGFRLHAKEILATADAAAPQAVGAVPAGIKVMTVWRNRTTGREGLYEAGSMPSVDEANPEYEFTRAFLIPAADAQWAMRHLDSLRDRVGGPALQSLDCVRSWLNAWRVAATPPAQAQQAPTDAEIDALHSAFERQARDSFGFKRSRKGTYQNPATARDWKWFQAGALAAQRQEGSHE